MTADNPLPGPPLKQDAETAQPTTAPPPVHTTDRPDRKVIFGIKAKLFWAFAGLASLTIVASATALFGFMRVDRTVARITADSIPAMVASLQLARKSAEISAIAPTLMSSISQEERVLEQMNLEQKVSELIAPTRNFRSQGMPQDTLYDLEDTQKRLQSRLQDLNVQVEERLRLESVRERALAQLARDHDTFLEVLEPNIDDAFFDLVMSAETLTEDSTTALTELVEGGVNSIYQLLTLNAEGNLVAGLLAEATNAPDPALIQPIRERFTAAAALVERSLRELTISAERRKLEQALNSLLAFGKDAGNIFDLRETGPRSNGSPGVAASTGPNVMLNDAVRSHEDVLAILIPMIDDATFDLVIKAEGLSAQSTGAINSLVEEGVDTLHALLLLRAEGNLTAGLLFEAANAVDVTLLQPTHERFIAATAHIEKILTQVSGDVDRGAVSTASQALIDLGTLNGNIFDLRRRQLRKIADARDSLNASRGLTVQLVDQVAKVVEFSQKDSDAAVRFSTETINSSKWVMLIVTGSSIAIAALMILFYVGPSIVQPLERITKAMTNLAGGDTTVDIPARDRDDELGRMARALAVFKDTAIEMQKSNLAEIREARQRLVSAIETITEGFSLYDSEDRLVICNNRYLKILYPDTSEEITPGMTFESIIRRAAEKGYVKAAENRVEEWVKERLASHHNPGDEPRLQQRGDETWVLVSERKTDDGGTVAVYSDVTELKQREGELASKSHSLEQLSNQLAKYLSPQVYESIFSGKQEVRITSRRKKLTVFFSDIVAFTETADRLESEELTQLLNHYLTEMSRIALDYGATIDKFIGDAIVIFFGDPESRGVKEDALACVEMAIAMRQRMTELKHVWRAAGIEKPLQCRMGISTDYCTVGNFGSEDRMDYTIIGGGVNLASRLEGLAQPGSILIAYETYAQIKDRIQCEECGEVKVKGIAYPVATYQVVDFHHNLEGGHHIIHESNSRLSLDLDLDAMTPGERKQTATILQRALDSITDTGNIPGSARPPEADDRKA